MIDDREIVERAIEQLTPPEPAFDRLLRRRDRNRRNERIAAGLAGFGVVAALILGAALSGQADLTSPPVGSNPPEPSVAPIAEVPGLPPEGAIPSAPERSDLVLQLEGGVLNAFSLWVFEDGRMIWWAFPQGAVPQPSSGLAEQRLTTRGVEFLRSRILATGLFDRDLELLADDTAPFLGITVRNGDRLVEVRWAWQGALQHPDTARPATEKQADALIELRAVLSLPASWPKDVWEDEAIRPYVPSTYAIRLRGVEHSVPSARILSLLPERAQRLLADAEEASDVPCLGCTWVSTEDARRLVEIMDAAHLVREASPSPIERTYLKYVLPDPDIPGNQLWVMWEPVLPHGVPTFLGPS